MELLLWRHAEAADAAPGQADLKRRLTARGEKQAHRVAHWLRENDPRPLRILVSPATRCQQTAHPLALPFETEARLAPDADVADLLAAANWPDGYGKHGGTVLLLGHQPALGRLAALLLSGQEADWTIKKGALWWFSSRSREGASRTSLHCVVSPEMLR